MDDRYLVEGYYGVSSSGNLAGLENSERSDDWSKVEAIAHDMLSNGDHIRITDTITGKYEDLHPEEYFDPYNGGFQIGEFPLKPQDLDPPYSLSEGINKGMNEMLYDLPAGQSVELGGNLDNFMDNVFMKITKDNDFNPEKSADEWNLVQVEFHIDGVAGPVIASTYDIHVLELETVLNNIRDGKTEYLVDENTPLKTLAENKFQEIEKEHENDYRMLDRLRMDCDYYLSCANSDGTVSVPEDKLWANSVEEQLNKMQEIYDSLPDNHKPEWLGQKDIDTYAVQMLDKKYPDGDKPIILQQVVVVSDEATEEKDVKRITRDIVLNPEACEVLYKRTGIEDRTGMTFKEAYDNTFVTTVNIYKNGTVNLSIHTNAKGFSEQEDVLLKPSEKAMIEDLMMGTPLPKVKQANHEEIDNR